MYLLSHAQKQSQNTDLFFPRKYIFGTQFVIDNNIILVTGVFGLKNMCETKKNTIYSRPI